MLLPMEQHKVQTDANTTLYLCSRYHPGLEEVPKAPKKHYSISINLNFVSW